MNLRFFVPFVFACTIGICGLTKISAMIDFSSFEIVSSEICDPELVDLIEKYLAAGAYDDYATFQLQFFLVKNDLAIKINEKDNTVSVLPQSLAKTQNGMVWSIDWIR